MRSWFANRAPREIARPHNEVGATKLQNSFLCQINQLLETSVLPLKFLCCYKQWLFFAAIMLQKIGG